MTNQPPTAGGPAAAPPATDPLASALRDATADTHEILGEIGRSPSNVVAYLARRRETEELVALQLVPDVAAGGVANYALTEHRELDDAVPSPRDACRVCQVPIPGWGRRCAVCGSEEPVVIDGTTPGTTRAELLEAVRGSTAGRYEVLGDICRAGGGGPVYFARELPSGQLTALRLLREGGGRPGGTQSYSLVAVPLLPSVQSGPSALPGVGGAGGVGGPPVSATGRVGVTWLFQGQAPGEERSDGAPTPGGTLGGATNAGGPPAKVCPQCGATYPVDVMFCPTDGAALRPIAATTSLIGQIIADRFHVLAKLGEGGMGQVYLAEHVQLGRRCAVKLMRQALTDDAEAAARFRREAKNASEIAHPNVATVFDFGATSDGLTYLVMEYVDGEPLSSTLAREGPLEPARVATIARQVAEALAAAHALGIVHRDLKPDNIMLAVGRDGREMVKVVDFGIAKAMEGVTQQVTRTGYRIGTPAYMSPEQIRGDALDGRSDLYSLGCILFELLTGRPPFEG
ncbi:MAG TPA: serine/threonine-protein kinase, partial [Gemmatimonadaceae bacterium]|nr:serine/threonine-protein kinase [Gemmatimonadaceae bacterium]